MISIIFISTASLLLSIIIFRLIFNICKHGRLTKDGIKFIGVVCILILIFASTTIYIHMKRGDLAEVINIYNR